MGKFSLFIFSPISSAETFAQTVQPPISECYSDVIYGIFLRLFLSSNYFYVRFLNSIDFQISLVCRNEW